MMGAAVMMACAGALGIKNANNVNDTGLVFIGLYMHIFAAILFCYEAIQIRPCDVLDTFYKRNFGFFVWTQWERSLSHLVSLISLPISDIF